jgi:hypothetical protein
VLLQLQKVLLEVGDSLCPLLKFYTLHLDGILEVHDHMDTGLHLLTCKVELLMGEVPPMLGLTKATVSGLQLQVSFCRLTCPTTKVGVLTLKPLHHM